MKKLYLVITIIMVLALTACGTNSVNEKEELSGNVEQSSNVEQKGEYRKISQDKAKEMMENGSLVLDVREKDEYDSGHIEGAILAPLGSLQSEILKIAPEKDTSILVYCRSGNRSKTASNILIDLGYTYIYDFGGIIDWSYEVVK